MKNLTISLIAVAFVLIHCTILAQQKYAALICGEIPFVNQPNQSWHLANPLPPDEEDWDEFWNDIYLFWELCIKQGYDNDNIFVFFNGISSPYDWSSVEEYDVAVQYNPRETFPEIIDDDEHITDYAATKDNVFAFFDGLANGGQPGVPQLTANDFLFVWTFSHGIILPEGNSSLKLMTGTITNDEFHDLIAPLPCNKIVLLFQHCFSGNFV